MVPNDTQDVNVEVDAVAYAMFMHKHIRRKIVVIDDEINEFS